MELPLATAQMSRDWVRSPVAMKHRSLPDQVPEATRRPGTTASLTQSRGSKATTCILTTWCCIKDNLADSLAWASILLAKSEEDSHGKLSGPEKHLRDYSVLRRNGNGRVCANLHESCQFRHNQR
jgi:hypothetical protein